jgi:methyl-accepting chemotaxis protein
MTSEEMERAIEILLNNQARYELQLEQTNQQLQQTNKNLQQTNENLQHTNRLVNALTESVGMVAQSHREFMQVMLQYMQSQDETNKTFREAIRELSSTLKRHITEDHGEKS